MLKSILVSADPALRESLAGLSYETLVRRRAAFGSTAPIDAPAAAVDALRLLALLLCRIGGRVEP